MNELMKKFREFQNEVFGSGLNGICNVQTYRNNKDWSIEVSVWFSESQERLAYEWKSWYEGGDQPDGDWEEFKEKVRAKL